MLQFWLSACFSDTLCFVIRKRPYISTWRLSIGLEWHSSSPPMKTVIAEEEEEEEDAYSPLPMPLRKERTRFDP